VVAHPAGAARLTMSLVGLGLLYAGVDALLRLLQRPPAAPPVAAPAHPTFGVAARSIVVPAIALLLIALVGAGFLASGEATEAAPRTGACNGSPELCDRPLPDVALVATHNSMSVPLEGWFSALQERPIRRQLEDGVRGLLIDTYYADRLANGRLRTVLAPGKGGDAVSAEAEAAALRLRERAGFRGEGERGMYLCHTFCELGATALEGVLEDLHGFLVTHPEEVVVVVNQDSVTPEDFVGALRAAGLDRLALTPPEDAKGWPTLREMIERDQRLVVLAENEAGAAPWYRLAYEGLMQETPYHFPTADDLLDPARRDESCRPLRGGSTAPLFLLNHWVTTDPVPRPSDASRVNARTSLLERARRCERIRGDMPNLVAVNFYLRGDVPGVVEELNGLR
jgi:hypothetical protein